MAKKTNLFNRTMLQVRSIGPILDNAINFECKVRDKEVTTRDILRADGLLKTLLAVSGEFYNTKGIISDKLIDAIICEEKQIVNKVNKELEALTGYKYNNLPDMVYYLTWFALSDNEPEFKTLKEYSETLCA